MTHSFLPQGIQTLPTSIQSDNEYPVLFREILPTSAPISRYQGFRPATEGNYPALVAWSPYGKDIGGSWLDDMYERAGVPLELVSEFQKFEGPDPAFWVNQGYVVLNPDARGIGDGEGNATFLGTQLAQDGADFIQWASEQVWSNGKVGLSGNSWLGISQWFIAAENPPALAAIAPWEGATDLFWDCCRGGIPMPAFPDEIMQTLSGKALIEDMPRMMAQEQTITPYWQDKIAQLEKIIVPAYVVACYNNAIHTNGSFDGFRRIASK
ncbi:MAG: CocE/NonD family hydrolase [Pasteurellaceae bacterium]|nr:CocE/NonD family hydrolase [Pasteurellaceae bacterium]